MRKRGAVAAVDKSVAISAAVIAGSAEHTLPRVLFICCDNAETFGARVSGSTVARSLRGENWPVQQFPVPTSWPHRLTDSLSGRLIGRLVAKMHYIRRLVRLIPGFDIVHVRAGLPRRIVRLALPAMVLGKFFGKKVVLELNRAESEHFLESHGRLFHPFLKAADRIVVGSRYLQKVVGRAGLEAERVTSPVDLRGLTYRKINQLQPAVLMNCPLERDFNVACAIRAFKLVKQKYPRGELTIVGDGSQRTALERMVEREHVYGVRFAGRVRKEELVKLYGTCDTFVHSASVDESPAAIVMAFASGLPVVVTDADGLLHMVRDRVSAMVVPVNHHAALADRMVELIEDAELTEKLSLAGRREARKYTWPRVRQDWVNVYNRLVS